MEQPEPESIEAFVERYADELAAAGAIRSAGVERAFRRVQRHRLLETFSHRTAAGSTTVRHDPERPRREHLAVIYAATALATRQADGLPVSSTSLPSLMAEMLELLELGRGMAVLEIGAGTGYNAALIAEIVGDQRLVTTVDILPDVVEQTRRLLAGAGYPDIRVRLGDGFEGAAGAAPFDRIVATAGCSDLSPHWAAQLADDGIMLIPLSHAGAHPLVLLRKDHGELRGRVVQWTGFIPVRGPLYIEGLWPYGVIAAAPAEIVRESVPSPRFATGGPDGSPGLSEEETGFLFFLGLSDRRAYWTPEGPGLSDGRSGWAALARDGISWWKDELLARRLDHYYQDWDARGRPLAGDYLVSFAPIAEERESPPGGWVIERRFYRELVTLGS